MSKKSMLTTVDNFDVSRLVFSQPKRCEIPNANPTAKKMYYYSVGIGIRDEKNEECDLILGLGEKYSFGVRENLNMQSGQLDGYKVPICMFSQNGPTNVDQKEVDVISEITDAVFKYVSDSDVYKQCGVLPTKNGEDPSAVKGIDKDKLNPLAWQRDKDTGELVSGKGPTFFVKLITSKKSKFGTKKTDENKDNKPELRIVSRFYETKDDGDEVEINPLVLQDKHHFITPAIKFESIYIASGYSRISLQPKLYEASFRYANNTHKRLIPSRKMVTDAPKSGVSNVASNVVNDKSNTTTNTTNDNKGNEGDNNGEGEGEGGDELKDTQQPRLLSSAPVYNQNTQSSNVTKATPSRRTAKPKATD